MADTTKFHIANLFSLKDYVCLVTGGGTGIGLMAAQALSANGAKVYITGRRGEVLQKAADTHHPDKHDADIHGEIIPITTTDVRSKDDLQKLIKEIESKESYLSLVVAAAGVPGPKEPSPDTNDAKELKDKLWDSEGPEDWNETFNVDVTSVYFTTLATMPLLQAAPKDHFSSVIVISSMSGIMKNSQSHFAYNSAKAATVHLSKMMSSEFSRFGVRVNSIAPGYFPSEMTMKQSDDRNKAEMPDEKVKDKGHETPAGRAGRDEEMGMAVIFLAKCAYVNGQILAVDGGVLNEGRIYSGQPSSVAGRIMASTAFATAAADTAQLAATNITVAASNATASAFTATSVKDIALFPLRQLLKIDRFLFTTLPRTVIQATGLNLLANRAIEHFRTGDGPAAAGGGGMAQAGEAAHTWADLFFGAFQQGSNKSYWGMLHYITSRWAFTCVLVALILNRVNIYGSSRQRIILTWNKRLALRLIPIMLFIGQMYHLLQAIQCQTSPEFSLYRHGDIDKYSILDWSTEGGALHRVSSSILFWSSDEQSCAAIGMSRPEPDVRAPRGSFSLLWPTFLRLSLSHLVENLSCSLQQIPVMTEVALSIFEHSLAFAEAETMIAHTITQKITKSTNATATTTTTTAAAASVTLEGTIPASGTILAINDAAHAFFGSHPFDRINIPVEVLLVALLSCGNGLTSHIIAIIGKKQKWRLANTAFWGLGYMAAFTWGFFAESEMVRMDGDEPKPVNGLLHFPTVAIVGFLPHMAVILGILVCGLIYLVALFLTAISLGTNPNIRRPTSLKERVSIAHDNLQAAIQLKTVAIRYYEDFYTALLRVGFAALTAASEAVFLNEGRAVEMRQFTWLEEERLDELDATRSVRPADEAHFQIVEEYGLPTMSVDDRSQRAGEWKSGYDKERKLEKKDKTLQNKDSFIYPNPRTDGVGALQRTTRFYLLFIFMRGILFTVGGWIAFGIGRFLDRIGLTARPAWLRKAIGDSLKQISNDRDRLRTLEENKKFDEWAQQSSVQNRIRDADIDIEHDMRSRIALENHENPQEVLDQKMYDWWKEGGWYSSIDESGDYLPPIPSIEQDDDATSVITTTTAASTNDDEQQWESEPEGARTPTQRHQSPGWSFAGLRQRRSVTPSPEAPILDNATLARLLNPTDQKSRDEARILSSHLSNNSIMTRSRYRRQFENDRAKVLLAGRTPLALGINNNNTTQPQSTSGPRPLTGEEEFSILEQLLITRRVQKQRRTHNLSAQNLPAFSDVQPHEQTSTGPLCVRNRHRSGWSTLGGHVQSA
ncbi:hypothetical protein PMZ80_001712 [Knufia obscura]|uniref:Uncharacterized protein n=1 Tax=Knufia obscura TaxID=1635080 RepID=A0ABR0S5C5_9EURO|nr:hypothetical protein PMZ80_001712 [Knufia obscura]